MKFTLCGMIINHCQSKRINKMQFRYVFPRNDNSLFWSIVMGERRKVSSLNWQIIQLWEVVQLHSKKRIEFIVILTNSNKFIWNHCIWTAVIQTVGSLANFKVSILPFFFFLQKISIDMRKLLLFLCPCKYSVIFVLFRQKIKPITSGNDHSALIRSLKSYWPIILKYAILWVDSFSRKMK